MNKSDSHSPIQTPEESKRHYTVPEGYFDNLADRIMQAIPEETAEAKRKSEHIPLWVKLKPIIYMAAAFLLMVGFFKVLRWQTNVHQYQTSQTALLQPQNEKTTDSLYMEYFYDHCMDLVNEDLLLSDL